MTANTAKWLLTDGDKKYPLRYDRTDGYLLVRRTGSWYAYSPSRQLLAVTSSAYTAAQNCNYQR